MKFGLSEDVIKEIEKIVKKYNKYQFKLFGSRVKNTFQHDDYLEGVKAQKSVKNNESD